MEQSRVASQNTAWENIAVEFRERAKKHERSASHDMLLIVATLISCVVIFAGADKLAEWIFKTSAERKADIEMANAKAEVYRAVASLGAPSSDFIRTLPAAVRPYLDRLLAEKTGKGEVPANNIPPPRTTTLPAVQPQVNILPGSNPPIFPMPAPTVRGPRSKATAVMQEENTQLYEKLKNLYDENTTLHFQLQQERERMDQASNQTMVEQMKSDAVTEAARIKADAEVNMANVATQRSTEINDLVSSALTRIGAVVMVIWLVKIFVKKRQQSVQLSTFYLAASDAALLSRGDMAVFSKLFSKISPAIDTDAVESPAEAMGQALVALAKRSVEN
jgi:hypothetical protein